MRNSLHAILTMLLGLLLFISTGCVGPKVSSTAVGYDTVKIKPAPFDRLAIRLLPSDAEAHNTLKGQPVGDALTKAVSKILQEQPCPKDVHVLGPSESPADPVLLEIRVMKVHNADRWERYKYMDQSSVDLTGRLVDTKHDAVLSLWSKARRSAGGPMGLGGPLVPSDEDLLETLVGWVAEDISAHVAELCVKHLAGKVGGTLSWSGFD